MRDVKQIHRIRLAAFFGESGAKVILDHMSDLELTFGSASAIILQVMDGQIPLKFNER